MNTSDSAQPPGPSSRPTAATLEFREATKRYPGQDEPAVNRLSLELPAGEICVLVGPSGCGKTTAMRMVNRMIDITDGDILLDGRSVKERQPAELRRDIGYAIQQIGLFPHLSVADNIATVPRLLGWDKARIRARVDELLELVSLDPHETRDRFPAQLSGGQRQRVGVARALAVDPPLMLMDEPFGAIDPINRERLQNEFLRLQQEIRKTIVFVTHDIDEAIKMGDHIAVLQKGGKLAQYAPPAELLMFPNGRFVEDFVGADRALKRLALQRVRDVDLWKAPLVRVGEPVAEARAKSVDSEVPYPLLIDAGRPPARLAVREGAPGRARGGGAALGGQAGARARRHPARRALPPARGGDPVRARGQPPRRGLRGALDRDARARVADRPRRGAERSGRRGMSMLLAQVEIRDRTDTCEANNGFCPDWIIDNYDRYVDPFLEHVVLTLATLVIGFAISFTLALIAYRRRWLINPVTQVTGILYTIPSIAAFFLLLPLTGRGTDTALIALVAYVLLIIFRNVLTGLDNVPEETKDAGRGMGLTDRQLLWRVEIPLALPEIMAGLRIAATTTVGLATLVFFAGAGGLGEQIFADLTFKSNVVVAGGLAVLLAVVLDGLILLVQRAITPWTRAVAAK